MSRSKCQKNKRIKAHMISFTQLVSSSLSSPTDHKPSASQASSAPSNSEKLSPTLIRCNSEADSLFTDIYILSKSSDTVPILYFSILLTILIREAQHSIIYTLIYYTKKLFTTQHGHLQHTGPT